MACERLIALFLALVLCIAAIEGSALSNRRVGLAGDELVPAERHDNVEMAKYMMMKLMDGVIEYMQQTGANESELSDMVRKRSGIRKCFFHAVNCW